MSELIDIYNSEKQKIGKIIERKPGTCLEKEEYIISVTCWIINSEGRILLTRRKFDKHNGGLWEPTTGLVISGETSLQGIIRELNEEIGIRVSDSEIKLVKVIKENRQDINFFRDIYMLRKDMDVNLIDFKGGEVIDVKYVTIDEFKEMINRRDTLKYLEYFIDLYDKIIK